MLASQRHLFEMPRQICYLNSASYSPLPLRTLEAGRAAVEPFEHRSRAVVGSDHVAAEIDRGVA